MNKKVYLIIGIVVLVVILLLIIIFNSKKYTLSFNSNPTTGYNWSYKIEDESIVTITDEYYKQNEQLKEIVGSGGQQYFVLKGLKKGKTTIHFTYKRSDDDIAEKQDVVVIVDKFHNIKTK